MSSEAAVMLVFAVFLLVAGLEVFRNEERGLRFLSYWIIVTGLMVGASMLVMTAFENWVLFAQTTLLHKLIIAAMIGLWCGFVIWVSKGVRRSTRPGLISAVVIFGLIVVAGILRIGDPGFQEQPVPILAYSGGALAAAAGLIRVLGRKEQREGQAETAKQDTDDFT